MALINNHLDVFEGIVKARVEQFNPEIAKAVHYAMNPEQFQAQVEKHIVELELRVMDRVAVKIASCIREKIQMPDIDALMDKAVDDIVDAIMAESYGC